MEIQYFIQNRNIGGDLQSALDSLASAYETILDYRSALDALKTELERDGGKFSPGDELMVVYKLIDELDTSEEAELPILAALDEAFKFTEAAQNAVEALLEGADEPYYERELVD